MDTVEISQDKLINYGKLIDSFLGSSDSEEDQNDVESEKMMELYSAAQRPERLGLGAIGKGNPKLEESLGDSKAQEKLQARILGHKNAFQQKHREKHSIEHKDDEVESDSSEEESIVKCVSKPPTNAVSSVKDEIFNKAKEEAERKRKKTQLRNLRKKRQKQKQKLTENE